jgi:hypothetical protein
MIQRPVVVGLLLCEQLIVEERTRNVTLVNCFTRLKCREIPSLAQRLVVYAALTDGLGEGILRLVAVRLDTMEDVYVKDQPIRFSDPLEEVRIVFRLADLSLPVAGRYQFSLLADGELVAQRDLQVTHLEEES